jgi:hypothetical protein
MIIKVEIRGARAYISGPPGSRFSSYEESAARVRPKFVEKGDAVGYFEADTVVLGESRKPEDPDIRPITAEVFEIKNRVRPSERW